MKAPQIIILTLIYIGLLIAAHRHGKPRSEANFWTTLIGAAINISLLIWGGFFN